MKKPQRVCETTWKALALVLVLAGACWAQAATLPQLRISANGRYLVKEDGTPFLYLADTAWSMVNWTRQDVDTYLEDRAQKGFTVIQISIAGFNALTVPNAYGQTIFVDRDPKRPNDAYFEELDYIANKAQSLGLYLALVPLWANNFERPAHLESFPDDPYPDVLDPSSAFSYGKYLGLRYRDKPVIWILGGDWFYAGYEDVYRSMAAGLKEGENGIPHLMTFHQKPKAPLVQTPWLDFQMIQTSHTIWNRSYDLILQDWHSEPTRPVVMGEGGYEGIADHTMEVVHAIDAADVRRIAYCAMFAGGAGYTYGAQGVWNHNGPHSAYRSSGSQASPSQASPSQAHGAPVGRWGTSPPWPEALQLPGSSQLRYLRALLESRPMLERIPDQWLIADDQQSTADRTQATRAADGSYAFIYMAQGRKLRVQLIDHGDAFTFFKKLSGDTIRAYWFNPRDGSSQSIGEFKKEAYRDFTPPSTGAGNDWVLVLDDASKNYPAPGTSVHDMP